MSMCQVIQFQDLDITDYCMNCPGDSCNNCLHLQVETEAVNDEHENVVDFIAHHR